MIAWSYDEHISLDLELKKQAARRRELLYASQELRATLEAGWTDE